MVGGMSSRWCGVVRLLCRSPSHPSTLLHPDAYHLDSTPSSIPPLPAASRARPAQRTQRPAPPAPDADAAATPARGQPPLLHQKLDALLGAAPPGRPDSRAGRQSLPKQRWRISSRRRPPLRLLNRARQSSTAGISCAGGAERARAPAAVPSQPYCPSWAVRPPAPGLRAAALGDSVRTAAYAVGAPSAPPP